MCLWSEQLRRCVIKGKTINVELDSAVPTARRVTDSPLLRLPRATVWCKQHRPASCYYWTCGFQKGQLIICACQHVEFMGPAAPGAVLLCSLYSQAAGDTVGVGELWVRERNQVGGSDWACLCVNSHKDTYWRQTISVCLVGNKNMTAFSPAGGGSSQFIRLRLLTQQNNH